MTSRVSLSAEDFDRIWVLMDSIRDHACKSDDLVKGLMALGLREAGMKLATALDSIDDETAEVQRTLLSAEKASNPQLSNATIGEKA